MKEIPLTQSQKALVDDADFDWLTRWRWCALHVRSRGKFYAVRMEKDGYGGRQLIYMHREILGLKRGDPRMGDHIARSTLDNRRRNLRIATPAQNVMNSRKRSNNSTGFTGIWEESPGRWKAHIGFQNKIIRIGVFSGKLEAAKAYDKKAIELHGQFASLNFPLGAVA